MGIGTPIYAPADGEIVYTGFGIEGGYTLWYRFQNVVMRCLHLKESSRLGIYREGQVIGYTGNTGHSSAPHVHIDISKGSVHLSDRTNFVDPDKFFLKTPMFKMKFTCLNADPILLGQAAFKLKSMTSLLDFDFEFHKVEPIIPQGDVLSQDEAKVYTDKIQTPFGFIGFQGKQNIWATTSLIPPVYTILADTRVDVFNTAYEIVHALQKYYNDHRGTNPPIQVDDILTPDDAFLKAKLDKVIPYLPYLAQQQNAGTSEVMTRNEVMALQILEGYTDESGIKFWTGKPLTAYLKARLADKAKQETEAAAQL